MTGVAQRHRALTQQGYDRSPAELRELEWGLRFTPSICMVLALVGLATRTPAVHFLLAAFGMGSFWLPAWHPFDLFYNHALRPLWGGVKLPPNPLPRRIACFMGGLMNACVGVAFLLGSVPAAYAFGGVLITLQLVVISSHFCVASWMYEGFLRAIGRWNAPVPVERARALLAAGAVLVDVRNPDEYARDHLPGAENVPVSEVARLLNEQGNRCLLLYCKSGLRSQEATQVLQRLGHQEAHNLGSMSRVDRDLNDA